MTKDAPPAPAQESHKDKNDSLPGISMRPRLEKKEKNLSFLTNLGRMLIIRQIAFIPIAFLGAEQ